MRQRQWNTSLLAVSLLSIVVLLLSSFLMATAAVSPSAPKKLTGIVDAPQKAEIVIPRACLADSATLHADFEMHIPVKENGEPDLAAQYSTGTLEIHPKKGMKFSTCATWHVGRKSRAE